LKGKIDRIDILPSESGTEYVIIDYKLSKSSVHSLSNVMDGDSFQLPLYAMAFQKLLTNNQDDSNFLMNLLYIIFRYYLSSEEYIPSKKNKSFNIIPLYVDKDSLLTNENKIFAKVNYDSLQRVLDIVKNAITDTVIKIKASKYYSVEPSKKLNTCKSCQFYGICKI
ncbi:MAG: PD-(D/E)XK nuclease family protein, partial [Candidatus Kapaibacteriota bacterium]